MKAVILAGGKGTRLKPYTVTIPKPLVPVGETAILEILIRRLINFGIEEIYICINHYAELIKAYFGNGEKYGIKINYSLEDQPLGTVAPIKLIEGLPQNFLVMNGDLLTDLDFKELYNYHINMNSLITVSTYTRKVKVDFGVINVEPVSQLASSFIEKPEYQFEVSMGVYAINKDILNFIPDNQHFGFDDLILKLLKENQKINTYHYDGYWLDIGRPEDYEKANEDFENLKVKLL